MSFINRNLLQDVTVWTAGATDVFGNPSFTVRTIKGRWEDKQIKAINFQGDEIISSSVVYVDSDVGPGDYVMLGVSVASTPPSAAKEVKGFNKSPSLKVNLYQRKAVL